MFASIITKTGVISVRTGIRVLPILSRSICSAISPVPTHLKLISTVQLQSGCFFHTSTPSKMAPQLPDATYEEIKDLPNHPEKYLIDVRNPNELQEVGQIPTSVNIPLPNLPDALKLSPEAFKAQYRKEKPSLDTEVIFHCLKGGRAQTAMDAAVALGWKKARNYRGSWTEWAQKEGLPK